MDSKIIFFIFFIIIATTAIKMPLLETKITTDRYIDSNVYNTLVGSRVLLPCNTTSATSDDQVALLLFYKEDTSLNELTKSLVEADKNELISKDSFLNHKAKPIYSIDAREAPLYLATHFPSDSINNSRLMVRFEPKHQQIKESTKFNFQNQKKRKKFNRKGSKYQNDSLSSINNFEKNRFTNKGMVYLEISNAVKEDAGTYRCRVDYRRGRTINWIITLSVLAPTSKLDILYENTILNSNSNIVKAGPYNEGSSINLTCLSDGGIPPPILQWYHNQKILNSILLPTIKKDQTALLISLNLTQEKNHKQYTCEAFPNNNSLEPIPSLSKTIEIDLNLKPKTVKIKNLVKKLFIFKPSELICQTNGSKPAAKLLWFLIHDPVMKLEKLNLSEIIMLQPIQYSNNKISNLTFFNEFNNSLQNSLNTKYKNKMTRLPDIGASKYEEDSSTTGFISLKPIIEDNGRRLVCIAFNSFFLQSNHYIFDYITLNVEYTPVVYLAMGASVQHEVILKGYDVFFQCNVQSNPSVIKIDWKFNDELLKNDEKLGIKITNTTLLLKNVNDLHSGKYCCYATNNLGTGQSEYIVLNVQYKPYCKHKNQAYIGVGQKEKVFINCEMNANPNTDLSYIWTFNDFELENSTLISKTKFLDTKKSQLVYTPQNLKDYGQFKCIGISSLGVSNEEDMCIINIIPADVPSVLTNCTQFNFKQNSFTLSCLAGFNGGLEQSFHLELWVKEDNEILSKSKETSNVKKSNELLSKNFSKKNSSLVEESILLLENINVKNYSDNKNTKNNETNDKNLTQFFAWSSNQTELNVISNLDEQIKKNKINKFNYQIEETILKEFLNLEKNSINPINDKEQRKIKYNLVRKNSNKILNSNSLDSDKNETYESLVEKFKNLNFVLVENLTSFDYPFFSVSLSEKSEFQLILYASNSKGRSKEIHLLGNNLLASHWQTDKIKEKNHIKSNLNLFIFFIFFFIFFVFSVFLILKFKKEKKIKLMKKNDQSNLESDLNVTQLNLSDNFPNEQIFYNQFSHNFDKKTDYNYEINQQINFCQDPVFENLNSFTDLKPETFYLIQDTNLIDKSTSNVENNQIINLSQVANLNSNLNLETDLPLENIYFNQLSIPKINLPENNFDEETKFQSFFIDDKLNFQNFQEKPTHCILIDDIKTDKLNTLCNDKIYTNNFNLINVTTNENLEVNSSLKLSHLNDCISSSKEQNLSSLNTNDHSFFI